MEEVKSVRITTIVDNDAWRKKLMSSWGLSLFVETVSEEKRYAILMDTGGSFETLFKNASWLGVNFSSIKAIFVSHWHEDHCGSLSHVLPLPQRPIPVYVPSVSTSKFRTIKEAQGIPLVCSRPIEFTDGLMSTGEMPVGISEHSLLINSKNKGLVVLVGCSHPGIINILKRAQEVSGVNKIFAVIGGFHISSVTEGIAVGNFLREIDVELVSPCHCTSIDAKHGIAKIMGERYIKNGSGKIISIG
jgi:7,8-dihydropterin-6-yl-methyl-4-(beta-D-ribofuranosyl)aminobenzene 5'-phosphate synthase